MRLTEALWGAWLGAAASAVCSGLRGQPWTWTIEVAAGGALVFGLVFGAWQLAQPLGRRAQAVLSGLGLAAAPLSLLGEVLKKATHHRPLGAVTFAVLALFICAGAVMCTGRWLEFVSGRNERARKPLNRALLAVVALSLGIVAAKALLTPEARGGAIDLGFGCLIGLAALRRVGLPRWAARVAVLPWVLTLAASVVASLLAAPALGEPADLLASLWRWLLGTASPV